MTHDILLITYCLLLLLFVMHSLSIIPCWLVGITTIITITSTATTIAITTTPLLLLLLLIRFVGLWLLLFYCYNYLNYNWTSHQANQPAKPTNANANAIPFQPTNPASQTNRPTSEPNQYRNQASKPTNL